MAAAATASACDLTGEWTFLPPPGLPWPAYGFTYNVVHEGDNVTFDGFTTPLEVRITGMHSLTARHARVYSPWSTQALLIYSCLTAANLSTKLLRHKTSDLKAAAPGGNQSQPLASSIILRRE